MEMKKRTRKVRRVQKAQGTWEVRRAQKAKVKRNYKDSMFRAIFKDKENLLSLYNAIQGSNHKNVDDLEINTLENAIYIAYKNDISFMIDTQLYLLEHQSSINPNYTAQKFVLCIRGLAEHYEGHGFVQPHLEDNSHAEVHHVL